MRMARAKDDMSTAFDTRPSATTYELEDLVRDVWAGKIRVPHFQRDFRWGRRDVQRLFDSIVRGYPIGSLLFWIRPAPAQKIRIGALTIDAPETDQAIYVVDGQQRITSLANALSEAGATDSRFALAYDLRSRTFVPRPQQEDPWVLPIPVISDLQKLLKWFNDHQEVASLLDQASGVTKTIRQYPIPVYNVRQSDAKVLQDVFDRMNNYGKRLSRAEVFSALFAEPEEHKPPTLTIDLITDHIDEELGFGRIDDDTVLKAILARRGPDVMREIRTEFDDAESAGIAEFPGEGRDAAYAAGEDALSRAVQFLQEQAGVPHFSFLPYRYLLVVLTRLFGHYPSLSARNAQLVRRWFWRAAVAGNQAFKGSSTGATRILCSRIRPNDLRASIRGLLDAVDVEPSHLPNLERFRTNTAEGKIALCGWWSLGPRSPYTAEPYDRGHLADALSGFSTSAEVVPNIVPQRYLPTTLQRMASNRMLVPSVAGEPVSELDELLTRQPDDIDDRTWGQTLRSHGISDEAVSHLRAGNVTQFLKVRQTALETNLRRFLAKMSERGFEDTPSLDELVVEDLTDAS